MLVEFTELVDELLVPTFACLSAGEAALAYHSHRICVSIYNEALGIWEGIIVQGHFQCPTHQLEVLLAAILTRESLRKKWQTLASPLWAVLSDFGVVRGEVFFE